MEEKQQIQEFRFGEKTNRRRTRTMSVAASDQEEEIEEGKGKEQVVDLDHGDPTVYEQFWQKMGDRSTIVISGWQSMSYLSDVGNICWFLEPEFTKQVRRLHQSVGNAVTEDRHIVVGTGSTQLFQAALYALSPPDAFEPISVVSAIPYYSSYPSITDYLKSGLYKWAGDAYTLKGDEPYIELVTSPNNPDGSIRQAVVNRDGGTVIHDLAYYWPQYTPITCLADHDLMLFTISKCTGHAGIRIGWALVKDKEVARKMTKFIELNTIGVSKDSQLRAAKILQVVSHSCEQLGYPEDSESFFKYASRLMADRWDRLRDAVSQSGLFSLPEFMPESCNYAGEMTTPHPAFAWLKCEGGIEDCENFLRGYNILTRTGKHFGAQGNYVRVSMLDREETFDMFIERLSNIRL
ncbi:PREDICTED: tryptophan aminotransferase-related protein 2-like isoform X2 [Nelumbo nucifera]|nr:PREDICTED: tryptophan aminotransferase-related protein 2-like isoform X2 [Nelumbo nucifera]XP_010248598.1 PREDICTED: tryptophan aminotransferase-related protein 2-like isoform X2 [Nelumbo nucifera]XP_010248599.1 PREDICTED: tryptophan aminotransferase-related protein 2-like isoform X2 [Nelumbo nucifera]XP_019052341.1 PREDICTED: tryptophan aminotransferase-related protein 2-like isoform X2 [Nelumbo nucifera]DAD30848.1 TPA_asm: hypothetical protein HUJ06_009699 [Nelumbo nucifera]